ncbi:hypothetical protein [Methanobrevibacter sp. UBA337]|jgi:hypothetical protein
MKEKSQGVFYTKKEDEYAQKCIKAVDDFREMINKSSFKKEYPSKVVEL